MITTVIIISYNSTASKHKVELLEQRSHQIAYEAFRKKYPTGKIILYWTTYFGFYFGDWAEKKFITSDARLGTKSFDKCPVKQCFATHDRSLLNDSHALIFHPRDIDTEDLPNHRLVHQRYIFYNLEPPFLTTFDSKLFKKVNGLFNWTMTYRKDSDIYHPNSENPFLTIEESTPSLEHLQNKKKKVAWFVSNCNFIKSHRSEYANELRKYIQLDIFGRCGSRTCEDKKACYRMLSSDYKFYLSFENSFYRDYVTEKFFNALLNDVVPIVYGAANYSSLITKNAFIHVDDFKSPRHLANYLNYLNDNLTAYKSYFDWRRSSNNWREVPYHKRNFCQLCEMLHNESLASQSYPDIHNWWYDKSYVFSPNGSHGHRLNVYCYIFAVFLLAYCMTSSVHV